MDGIRGAGSAFPPGPHHGAFRAEPVNL